MTDLLLEAQIAATATLLDVDPDELAFLQKLDAQQVAQLRRDIAASFFDAEARMFSRVSRLAPVVPDKIVGTVAEKAIPPLVAGRACGALAVEHPDRIGGVLAHVSPEYMADCAPHLDHRVIDDINDSIEPAIFVPAAHILLDREDYATAAVFVEHSPIELAAAFEQEIDDDRGLLITVALVPNTDKMRAIVDAFPTRVGTILQGMPGWDDLALRAGVSLLGRLDPDRAQELLTAALAPLGDTQLAEVVAHAVELGLLGELEEIAGPETADRLRRAASGDRG